MEVLVSLTWWNKGHNLSLCYISFYIYFLSLKFTSIYELWSRLFYYSVICDIYSTEKNYKLTIPGFSIEEKKHEQNHVSLFSFAMFIVNDPLNRSVFIYFVKNSSTYFTKRTKSLVIVFELLFCHISHMFSWKWLYIQMAKWVGQTGFVNGFYYLLFFNFTSNECLKYDYKN